MVNIYAEELVDIWMRNSIGGKEDFDTMIIGFLKTLRENVSVSEVLHEAKKKALEETLMYPEDKALQLSYKAFKMSLEYQVQLCQIDKKFL